MSKRKYLILSERTHQALKHYAITQKKTMSEIGEKWIWEKLNEKGGE